MNGVFVFDDIGDIVNNQSAQAATFWDRLGTMNRPLTKASYAGQDALHGLWPAAFHAINGAIHLLTTLLAYALVRRAAIMAGYRSHIAPWLSFAVVAVWAIHPALTETVTYVSGRSMALAAMLMLAALVAISAPPARGAAALALAASILAPLARETALILPAVAIWWQMTVQPAEPWRAALRRIAPILAGTAIAAAIILLTPRHQDLIGESLRSRPPLDALLGNIHAAADILGFWFTPHRVTIDPAPPLAWPWTDGRTLLKIALFASLGLMALALRPRAPLIAFGLGLSLLALVPSNTVLWRVDPASLKPLYLAGLGLTLVAGTLLMSLPRARLFITTSGLILVAFLSVQTVQRNALFADEIALWQDAAQKTPAYGRPWIMLGYALFNAGRHQEAFEALTRGTDLSPWDEKAAVVLEMVTAALAAKP